MSIQSYAAPIRPTASNPDDQRVVDLVVSLVAVAAGLSARRILERRSRCQPARRARRLAMYLTATHYGWPLWRVAAAFGSDRATATTACRCVEDERDDPDFDRQVGDLEGCLRVSPSAPVSGWGADDDQL